MAASPFQVPPPLPGLQLRVTVYKRNLAKLILLPSPLLLFLPFHLLASSVSPVTRPILPTIANEVCICFTSQVQFYERKQWVKNCIFFLFCCVCFGSKHFKRIETILRTVGIVFATFFCCCNRILNKNNLRKGVFGLTPNLKRYGSSLWEGQHNRSVSPLATSRLQSGSNERLMQVFCSLSPLHWAWDCRHPPCHPQTSNLVCYRHSSFLRNMYAATEWTTVAKDWYQTGVWLPCFVGFITTPPSDGLFHGAYASHCCRGFRGQLSLGN